MSAIPLIDVHTHLAPQNLEHAVAIMDRNHIEVMVDISPLIGDDLTAMLEAVGRFPGRFYCFTGVDFSGIGTSKWLQRELDQLARAKEMGVVGVKFAKSFGLTIRDESDRVMAVDDMRLAPLLDRAGELGLLVAFHTADPKAFFQPLDERNERWQELKHNPEWWFGDRRRYPYGWWSLIRQLEKVVARHPHTLFMGAHFGCAAEEVEYVAEVMRDYSNYLVDIAARIGEIGRHDPGLVHEIFTAHQDRILFGTDLGLWEEIMLGAPQPFSPTDDDVDAFYAAYRAFFETNRRQIDHPTPIQGDWKVDAIGLSQEILAKVYHGNARRYLHLKE